MKTIKFIIIALLFFIAGFFLGQSLKLPAVVTNLQEEVQPAVQTVVYILQFSDTEVNEFQDVAIKANQTVLDVLKEVTAKNNIALATKDYKDLGALVERIGDKTNDQDNKYWQYFVNGELAKVGASSFKLTGGERVEWKFMEFKNEF